MAQIDDMINGYRLRSLLQVGQDSQVFEVVEPTSNRHFAMKILLPEASGKSHVRQMLFNEADIGVKLRHENVIRIVKVDKSPKTPHFIMEYFPSGSLRNRIKTKDSAFLKEHAHRIFVQSALGLAYMHGNGYVHRDVKPDNMLVNASGEFRLIDFAISRKVPTGFAKWFHRKGKTQGTPSFMAPEQIKGELPDPRSDIYSLGCTFYELLLGRPPFRGKSQQDLLNKHFTDKPDPPKAHDKDISDEVNTLIQKMLAKKMAERPQSCHEVLMALRKMRVYISQPVVREDGSTI